MNLNFIFGVSALYTLVLFGLQVFELLTGKPVFNFPAINAVYLGLLSVYVGGKEAKRWAGELHAPGAPAVPGWRLPGEWFVGLWAVALPGASLLVQFWPDRFHYPGGINTITVEVLGFYLGSNVSRWLKLRGETTRAGLENELQKGAPSDDAPTGLRKRVARKRIALQDKIVAAARKKGGISREDVEAISGLKRSSSGVLLNQMVAADLLRRAGEPGNPLTRYTADV